MALLAAAGLATAALRAPSAKDAGFAIPEIIAPERGGPEVSIDLSSGTATAHAPALAVLGGGELLVAWYAGTREGARDVSIRMARVSGGRVVAEWESLTRSRLEQMVHRFVRKLGNAVMWVSPDGTLHLFVVSVSFGGWSGSSVNHLRSVDGGRTWLSARRLVLSPFLNLSTLVRTPPVALDDGSILLPAYHEFLQKWGMTVRLSPSGRVTGVSRIPAEPGLLQPAVAPLDHRRAATLLRSGIAARPRVFHSTTEDSGATWSPAAVTGIPNRDNSVALLRLTHGRLLAAANSLESGRSKLDLLTSDDAGGPWQTIHTVESGGIALEYSYPALAQSPDGMIHLAYSVNRRSIRVRSFVPSSFAAGRQEARP